MSTLIEKVRLETRLGNFNKVKRILATNIRHFASFPKAEQNTLLLAMINIREPKLLFRHLGPELNEEFIIKSGVDEFKRQLIIALAHMWFGSELVSFRIANRLENILSNKQIHFNQADLKRVLESLSSVFDAQAKFLNIIQLEKLYPSANLPETEHTDRYFYRKYYLALFNTQGPSSKIVDELKEIQKNTLDPLAKIFLFCDICFVQKNLGTLTNSKIVSLIKKEKVLKFLKDKELKLPWIELINAQAELDKKSFSKAKKHLVLCYEQSQLPVEKVYSLTLFHYHFPDMLKLEDKIFLWTHHSSNFHNYSPYHKDPYYLKIKQEIETGDCWLISKNEVYPTCYSNYHSSKNLIDLYSGIIIFNGKPQVLSSKRIRLLMALISKGGFGCNEIELVSKVYPEIRAHLAFKKIDSLKNLSLQFKKFGISIKKNKNFYFFKFHNGLYEIILPKKLETVGVQAFCSKQLSIITPSDLTKLLNIKRTKAFELLREWKKQKILKPSSTEKHSFIFKN